MLMLHTIYLEGEPSSPVSQWLTGPARCDTKVVGVHSIHRGQGDGSHREEREGDVLSPPLLPPFPGEGGGANGPTGMFRVMAKRGKYSRHFPSGREELMHICPWHNYY